MTRDAAQRARRIGTVRPSSRRTERLWGSAGRTVPRVPWQTPTAARAASSSRSRRQDPRTGSVAGAGGCRGGLAALAPPPGPPSESGFAAGGPGQRPVPVGGEGGCLVRLCL
jgi:hypothetical protein